MVQCEDIYNDSMETSTDTETLEEVTSNPQTYIVLKFSPNVNRSTIHWIVDRIRGKRRNGGAELLIKKQPYDPDEVSVLPLMAKNTCMIKP